MLNGLLTLLKIISNPKQYSINKKVDKTALPSLFEKALAINFDDGNYHDYFENAEQRYDYFHTVKTRIPFKLKMLNKITNGGLIKKTLNIVVMPTGAGKTMFMCDQAADWLSDYNVLYVTLEMAEELIANRIDANLMDIEVNDTTALPKENFLSRINKLRKNTVGQLFVKEFPPNNFNSNDLASLIDEIKQLHGIEIDIVCMDYLNLASAMRYNNSGDNSYAYVKAIAEEFRACAIKKNFCLLTATQTNRDGQNNSDFELNQVSESHGLSMTADFMIGGIATADLEAMKQMRLKQLKNRYGSLVPISFQVGIDRAKMKLFDVDLPTERLEQRIQEEAALDNVTAISDINKKENKNQLKF
jgi:predicted ATP-dependent serine protease